MSKKDWKFTFEIKIFQGWEKESRSVWQNETANVTFVEGDLIFTSIINFLLLQCNQLKKIVSGVYH